MSPPNRSEIMSIEDTYPAEGAAQEPPLRDEPGQRPLAGRRTLHEGMVFDLVRDTVDFADGVRFDREYIWHTGAVAVLAIDDADRVLLIRQYRHRSEERRVGKEGRARWGRMHGE